MLVRAVAFDVDGTLYSNRPMYARSAVHVVSRIRFIRAFAKVRRQIRREYPVEDFRVLQSSLLADILGVTTVVADELIRDWLDIVLDSVYKKLTPFPYVKECIGQLRAAGLKTAVLSDFPMGNKISYLGLDGLWDCELSSEESGYLKPRSEPFHMLAERLGVLPEHIVYIGNNYEYDVVGAQNAGMKTAHLTRRTVKNSAADVSFSDYRDLAPAIFDVSRSGS